MFPRLLNKAVFTRRLDRRRRQRKAINLALHSGGAGRFFVMQRLIWIIARQQAAAQAI
jgi:hypothetical protein